MDIECHSDLTGGRLVEWQAFLADSPHQHPRQTPRFAEVEAALGNVPLYVLGRRNGRVCAVALFSLRPSKAVRGRFSVASALSGPVCDDSATMVDFLRQTAAEHAFTRVDAMKITPYWLEDEAAALVDALAAGGWVRSDPEPIRHTGLIDLTRSEDALRSSFSRSARRKVRLAERAEIEIRRVDTLAEAEVFFERLNSLVLARHRLTQVGRAEYEAGFRTVYSDPAAGAIFAAYHEGSFLGGLLLYRSDRTAHARRYVADPEAAKAVANLRVAPVLWLEGILWAKRQGCTQFDVEGFRPLEGGDDPQFNVYEYKREFGPVHTRRIAEHALVLNAGFHLVNQIPEKAKRMAKRTLPGAVSRARIWLPSRRRK